MTLPLEKDPNTGNQNSISMSQVNVELFFDPTVTVALNQVTVRNLFQKPDNLSTISLWDGFGKSNIGKPKNPTFTLITQSSAKVSWGESEGICNKYTVTVTDARTDSIIYGTPQNFTTSPLQTYANLTGLSSFPTISAAGTPTATTFKSVAGFSVAFTYSTFGVALTPDTWYRLSGNSNALYNKVVQVISSDDATHAVVFYPGTTPGTWGSGTTLIMKIETITSAGTPAAVAFNGSQILPYVVSASLPVAFTYNSTPGFSVDFTHTGTSLIANAWYRISGNTNLLYNNPVQVISVNGTTASVFYSANPEVFGITTVSPTTILKVEKISAAGTPTLTTFNGVTGFSVEYTYSSIGAALTANSWYRIEGNSNPLYNANVQVISSADVTHAVVFYPGTTPGTWGTGTTTIIKVETFSSTGVPITVNSIYGYSVAYTYSSLGAALTTGSWYRIENNSNTAYNKYVQVISSLNSTSATVFYAGTTALGAYGTGTTTIVDDSISNNNLIVKTQPITTASVPTAVTYNSVAGYSVSYLYATLGIVLSVNSWCRISGNSNTAYNGYIQVISSADTTHAVLFYPSNPGVWGSGTTTISTTANYIVHLLASNTNITPLPTAETVTELLTLEIVPLMPTTPIITVISKNILRVSANSTYASSYDIFEVISGVDTPIATNVQIPYDHTVVTYSTHTYKVKGRSTGGVGTISAASTATISLPDFPIAATNLSHGSLTNITSSTIAVTWTKSISPVIINQRVRVLLQADGIEKYSSGLLANNTVGHTSTSVLLASTVYNAYIDTINEAGTAVSSVVSFTTKTAQPSTPSAGATSQTSITVTWGVTTGATSYVLYRNGTSVGTQVSPFIDNTGITTYSTHSYQVAAINAGGESVKSNAVTETSWPELPVNVTNVILTPDMNSISISWNGAATTSTRTVDGYRVYVYLTSNMSQVYDSGTTLLSTTSTSTTSSLVGWTGYTIRIYTYNRAGSIYIDNTVTTLADVRPDPQNLAFASITNQEPGTTDITGSLVTIGTFTPGYNTGGGVTVSASGGTFQTGTTSLTTGWVTTATVIPDVNGNIVFQPRMNASINETSTVTSTFAFGGARGGSRTLSVTTRDPNPPANVTATGGTGIATISWTYNSLYTYTVTADTGQTKTGITSGSVVLGDLSANNPRLAGTRTFSVYARNSFGGVSSPSSASASAYVTPMPQFTYGRSASSVNEANISPFTESFTITTSNVSDNTTYNWSISGVSASDFVGLAYTGPNNTIITIPPATSGSITVYSNFAVLSFTMVADHFTEGPETMTFQLTGSPVGDFTSSSISMIVVDTSLNPDLIVGNPIWTPAVSYMNNYNSSVSTSGIVYGLEPSWPISMNAIGGEISANNSTWGTTATGYTNGSGELTVFIRQTLGGSQRLSKSMEYQIESNNRVGWTAWTITQEYISMAQESAFAGQYWPINFNNGYPNTAFTIYKTAGSIGNVNAGAYTINGSTVFNSFLDSNGYRQEATLGGTSFASEWGTFTISAYFSASGHTVSSNTLYAYPKPTVSIIPNVQTAGMSINISIAGGWPSSSFIRGGSTASGTAAWSGSLTGGPTWTLSASGTYGFNTTIPANIYGSWSITFDFLGGQSAQGTMVIAKSAPNGNPTIGTITAKNGTISVPWTLGTSTAGPIDGIHFDGAPGYSNALAKNQTGSSGTAVFTGLTNGTTYNFIVQHYNSELQNLTTVYNYGPASSVYSITPILEAPVIATTTITSLVMTRTSITFSFTSTANTGGPANAIYFEISPGLSMQFVGGPANGDWNYGPGTNGYASTVPFKLVFLNGSVPAWNQQYTFTMKLHNEAGYAAASAGYPYTIVPDTTPNPFSFTAVTNSNKMAYYISNEIVISGMTEGIDVPVSINASGDAYPNVYQVGSSSSGGSTPTTQTATTVTTNASGQLYAKVMAALPNFNTSKIVKLTVGGVEGSWSFSTRPGPPTSVTIAYSNITQTTATITVSAGGGGTPTSYAVKRFTDVYYSTETSFTLASQSGNVFNISGLSYYSEYYFLGYATNGDGTGQSTGNTLTTLNLPTYNESFTVSATTNVPPTTQFTFSISGGVPSSTFTMKNDYVVGSLSGSVTLIANGTLNSSGSWTSSPYTAGQSGVNGTCTYTATFANGHTRTITQTLKGI